MTEARAARPILATVISIYEIIIFVFAVIGIIAMLALRTAHPELSANANLMQICGGTLSAFFGLAGGIYLWQMRQAAGRMLAGKVVLDIIVFVLLLSQPASMPGHKTALITGLLGILVNAAIAWYAYKVTCPTVDPTPAS